MHGATERHVRMLKDCITSTWVTSELYIHFAEFFQDLDYQLITKLQQVKDNVNDIHESQELFLLLPVRDTPNVNHLAKLDTYLKELHQKRDLIQQQIWTCRPLVDTKILVFQGS